MYNVGVFSSLSYCSAASPTRTKVGNSKGKPDLLCFSRLHDTYSVSVSFVPPAAELYCIWELKECSLCLGTMCLRLNGNILFLSH